MSGRGSLTVNRGTSVDTRSDVDSPICIKKADGSVHDVHCEEVYGEDVTVQPFHVAADLIGPETGYSLCTACLGSEAFRRVLEGE